MVAGMRAFGRDKKSIGRDKEKGDLAERKKSSAVCAKSSGIGGQAVLEGVMMRGPDSYAVAVRRSDGEIEVKKERLMPRPVMDRIARIPFVRGMVNLVDSLIVGMKTLSYSASVMEEDEEGTFAEENTDAAVGKETDTAKSGRSEKRRDDIFMGVVMVAAVILALGLFMVVPYLISLPFTKILHAGKLIVVLVEAAARVGLFVGYIVLISRMRDIQRVFMYHGAEHKCINCIEHGMELDVANVRASSRLHRRCGTSFLFYVLLVSVVVCFFIEAPSPLLRILIRIALIPVIAGIAYELIRLSGRSDNPVVLFLCKPGLALQRLTTREPDDEMIEVGIRAVEEVFDWRKYLRENFVCEGDETVGAGA